ncbi:hypothetical protein HELRODRAFT_65782, partial [Helobdella robusta]|uniref:BLOC-1-related complex subunit 5 n=1 Tax=Helobdella robusta TaxID=6412 RepID=T1FYC6_HELRO
SASKSQSVNTKIIVVAEGSTNEENEDNNLLKKLDNISTAQPFLPLTISLTSKPQFDVNLHRLNGKLWSDLFSKYQDHLKQCSDVVLFDQNNLVSRIKELDLNLQTHYLVLIEKRNKFAKYTEQVQKVQEISSALKRIHSTLQNTIHTMNNLNSLLPPNEQLEVFTLSSNTPPSTSTTNTDNDT